MTVEQFWREFLNKNNNIAVHCKTQEEANKFCRLMDKHGLSWWTGESYLGNNCWGREKENTCYTNEGFYDNYDFYKEVGCTIYEYSSIFNQQNVLDLNDYDSINLYRNNDGTYRVSASKFTENNTNVYIEDYKIFMPNVSLDCKVTELLSNNTIETSDTVKVIYKTYTLTHNNVKMGELFPKYITNFVVGKYPECEKEYLVLDKNTNTLDTIYLIQDKDTSQVFLIYESGIKKVEKVEV